jgi:hypothetical protein
LSDDDLVLPGFYQAYRQQAETHACSVIMGQSIFIDNQGQWFAISAPFQPQTGLMEDALKKLSKSNRVHTPAIVVAREAYEKVGGFTSSLLFTPDWEMWTRLASTFQLAYISTPLSCFRLHPSSETSRLALSGDSILDCFNASKIIQSRIQNPNDLQEVSQFLSHWLFQESLKLSQDQAHQRLYKPALIHARWAFKLNPSMPTIRHVLPILLTILTGYLKGNLKFLFQRLTFTSS